MVDHSRQLVYQKNSRQLKIIIIYTYWKCIPLSNIYIDKWLIYVSVCVCVYVHYCLYIWARWVVEIMKIWQLINFDCIYYQNFSMKTKFILGFLFIMIISVSLHNIHVLNYTRNIFKKLHTKYQKIFSSSFSRSLPNTGKWDNFLENALWKMNHFPEKVNMLKQTEHNHKG